MKTKTIRIGIKDIATAMDGFAASGEALSRGQTVQEETGIYFTSIEAFRRAITPRRMELLHIIKNTRPESINQLAKMAQRNIKNVAEDIKFLSQVGLVETESADNRLSPLVDYDEINLRIAV